MVKLQESDLKKSVRYMHDHYQHMTHMVEDRPFTNNGKVWPWVIDVDPNDRIYNRGGHMIGAYVRVIFDQSQANVQDVLAGKNIYAYANPVVTRDLNKNNKYHGKVFFSKKILNEIAAKGQQSAYNKVHHNQTHYYQVKAPLRRGIYQPILIDTNRLQQGDWHPVHELMQNINQISATTRLAHQNMKYMVDLHSDDAGRRLQASIALYSLTGELVQSRGANTGKTTSKAVLPKSHQKGILPKVSIKAGKALNKDDQLKMMADSGDDIKLDSAKIMDDSKDAQNVKTVNQDNTIFADDRYDVIVAIPHDHVSFKKDLVPAIMMLDQTNLAKGKQVNNAFLVDNRIAAKKNEKIDTENEKFDNKTLFNHGNLYDKVMIEQIKDVAINSQQYCEDHDYTYYNVAGYLNPAENEKDTEFFNYIGNGLKESSHHEAMTMQRVNDQFKIMRDVDAEQKAVAGLGKGNLSATAKGQQQVVNKDAYFKNTNQEKAAKSISVKDIMKQRGELSDDFNDQFSKSASDDLSK